MLEAILLIIVMIGSWHLGEVLADIAISIENKIKGF